MNNRLENADRCAVAFGSLLGSILIDPNLSKNEKIDYFEMMRSELSERIEKLKQDKDMEE